MMDKGIEQIGIIYCTYATFLSHVQMPFYVIPD